MKKLSILLLALLTSGAASAVTLDGPGTLLMTDCDVGLLNEDVRINLTTGVVAGISCTTNCIAIATCHEAGRKASRTANVRTCTTEDDPDTPENEEAGCTEVATTVQGPAMANATTTRGTVTTGYPEGDCTASDAETFADTL